MVPLPDREPARGGAVHLLQPDARRHRHPRERRVMGLSPLSRMAMARVRRTLGIPENYTVLFLQGGASLQFYMSALNLLRQGEAADFLLTGGWAKKAVAEAARIGDAQAIWEPSEGGYRRVPSVGDYSVREEAVYLHYTSNNTLYGTQFHHLPDSGGKPLVLDASSDIAGVPIDISAHDLIYAGAQKNLGPSGVTLVILSPWALSRVEGGAQQGVFQPCSTIRSTPPRVRSSTHPIPLESSSSTGSSTGSRRTADWLVQSLETRQRPSCFTGNSIGLTFGFHTLTGIAAR
uniref:Phosphoserine aminotransferase (SerC, PSAT1) n=1 Tax=uncultured marine group II/III euryarchaeote KM3_57_F04 TaxID=1456465 RepID=A0A075HEZ9_9EURY|nr:phosphoserine aminotransferase (serC, PSAT1) [uncultured marine group II/III euryarchaeote KM3_57_F04]